MQQQTCFSNVFEFAWKGYPNATLGSRRSSLLSDDQTNYNDSQEHIRSSISRSDDHNIPDCDPSKIQDLWDIVRLRYLKMTDLESRLSFETCVLSQVSL